MSIHNDMRNALEKLDNSTDKKRNRIFLYKRCIDCQISFVCAEEVSEQVCNMMIDYCEFDGAMVVDGNGMLKSMYGYCGV